MARYTGDDPDFLPVAFWNMNHLGLSKPHRFNAKLTNAKYLVNSFPVVCFSEIHNSAAVAYDAFFRHLQHAKLLFHCPPSQVGLAIAVADDVLGALGISSEQLPDHHEILVEGVAHGFWYQVGEVCRLIINIHLDAHSAAERVRQMRALRGAIRDFAALKPGVLLETCLGGDRNFVVDEGQKSASSQAPWFPGQETIDAWMALLDSIGASGGGELFEHTFRRSGVSREGDQFWIAETLDFARAGFDPLRHAHRQQTVRVVRESPVRNASDHLPVAVCVEDRPKRPNRARQVTHARVKKPMPDWLCYSEAFLSELAESVDSWRGGRSLGLKALEEFQELVGAVAKDFLLHRKEVAQSALHKFDVTMNAYLAARTGRQVQIKHVNKWIAVYPALSTMMAVDVDVERSVLTVTGAEMLLNHLHELVDAVTQEKLAREEFEGGPAGALEAAIGETTTAGNTLIGHRAHPGVVTQLKTLVKQERYEIVRLWNEEREEYLTDHAEIGEHKIEGRTQTRKSAWGPGLGQTIS